MGSCGRRQSLALHPSQRSNVAQNSRGFQLGEQLLVLPVAALDVELQANVLSGVAASDVLHQTVMRLKDAGNLLADFFYAGTGDFIAGHEQFQIQRFLGMAEEKK